jgi:hypothetical protein
MFNQNNKIMEGAFFLFVILAAVGSLLSEYVKAVEYEESKQ